MRCKHLYMQYCAAQACLGCKFSKAAGWDFSGAVNLGLSEDGELVCAATVRLHECYKFLELAAFATHKHHYRQGKGRLMNAIVKDYAKHQVPSWLANTRPQHTNPQHTERTQHMHTRANAHTRASAYTHTTHTTTHTTCRRTRTHHAALQNVTAFSSSRSTHTPHLSGGLQHLLLDFTIPIHLPFLHLSVRVSCPHACLSGTVGVRWAEVHIDGMLPEAGSVRKIEQEHRGINRCNGTERHGAFASDVQYLNFQMLRACLQSETNVNSGHLHIVTSQEFAWPISPPSRTTRGRAEMPQAESRQEPI